MYVCLTANVHKSRAGKIEEDVIPEFHVFGVETEGVFPVSCVGAVTRSIRRPGRLLGVGRGPEETC